MRIAVLFAASLIASAACTVEPDLSEGAQSVVSNNRLASNRLASNRLASNRLASNRLASNRLASNHLEANALALGDLIETVEGRDLLGYVISCALPQDVTFTATDSHGTSYDFFGGLGLAPRWIDHALDRQGKRWVSACLFARVNALNVAVPISMRGPHKELVATPDEIANWPLQEGAFWGDWFVPEPAPLQWYACRGKDEVLTPGLGGLAERECTEPDPANPGHTICGFIDAGDCGDYAPPASAHACNHFSSHGYWISCAADTHGGSHHDYDDDHDDAHPGADAMTDDHRDDDRDDGDRDHDDDDDGHGHGANGQTRGRFHQVITTFIQ